MAVGMNRRMVVAGVGAMAAAPLAGSANATTVLLTINHAGRQMLTRDGERIGPLEYDVAGFGLSGEKRWRAPIGCVRAFTGKTAGFRTRRSCPTTSSPRIRETSMISEVARCGRTRPTRAVWKAPGRADFPTKILLRRPA